MSNACININTRVCVFTQTYVCLLRRSGVDRETDSWSLYSDLKDLFANPHYFIVYFIFPGPTDFLIILLCINRCHQWSKVISFVSAAKWLDRRECRKYWIQIVSNVDQSSQNIPLKQRVCSIIRLFLFPVTLKACTRSPSCLLPPSSCLGTSRSSLSSVSLC